MGMLITFEVTPAGLMGVSPGMPVVYGAVGSVSPALPGELAPRGSPDNDLNAADLLIRMKILDGEILPDAQDLERGDIYPPGAPNDVLDLSVEAMDHAGRAIMMRWQCSHADI